MKSQLFALLMLLSGLAQAGTLVGLSPDELQAMQAQGALVVDVRTPEEWRKTGLIPGSHGLTYFDATGGYDKAAWLRQLKPLLKSPDQPLVLVCRSGNRTQIVGKMLAEEAGYAKVYHLEKGIKAWSAENRPLAGP
ncbi:MAG: rhodanese-like domain-containing protein [Candidatus Methylumidiphilus sp.]